MQEFLVGILKIDWAALLISLIVSFYYFMRLSAAGDFPKLSSDPKKLADTENNDRTLAHRRGLKLWLIALFVEGAIAAVIIYLQPSG